MQNEQQDEMQPQQIVTIHDVARAAGVTIGTVSKVLHGQGKLRSETRERVQAEALRLGFRPNDLAQSLLRKRSFTVGLITTDSYGRFSIPLMSGIEDALETARISVFLCDARDDPLREQQHIDSLLAKRVDGIIVTGRRTDPRPPINIGNTGTPVIYAYTQVTEAGALCLLPDEAQGARLAIEHLFSHGRRHLAHVTGPARFEAVQLRMGAMREVLREREIDLSEHCICSGPWSEAWGYESANFLLATDPRIDAIFCGSDQIARGVVDGLHERGVRIPDDVMIVGYDNWEIIAAATRPPLTTVDMNMRELGRQAGRQLLAMIGGEKQAGIMRLPCSLIIRDSCGPHRA